MALAALQQDASQLSKKLVDLFNQTHDEVLREKLNSIGPDQITIARKLEDLLNEYCSTLA